MKIRCYKIEHDGKLLIARTLPELIEMICDGDGHFPEAEVDDIINITVLEMTQEELELLPEYDG